ncbi:MAG: AFG1-like ATPase-domain-containing protein [Monoraphidium minutum]|nr:MAG: AFG1-like ATPase-domain-containing protein [Monoraphidium minutum]
MKIQLVRDGSIQRDDSQLAAAQTLQLLQAALAASAATPDAAAAAAAAPGPGGGGGGGGTAVRGAYLWGPVGSGKTLLLDLFARTLPPGAGAARRMHLHQLLAHVHKRSHQLQQALPRIVVKSRLGLPVYRYALPEEDFLVTIARELSSSCRVLCVDELHLADAADAAALGRLLGALLEQGGWAAFTGGANRRYLADGFVRLCDEHLLTARVAGGRDYRSTAAAAPAGAAAAAAAARRAAQQGGGGEPRQEAGAEGADVVGRCFVGPGGSGQLERAWQQAVAGCAGGREQEASVVLRFGRELWVPRGLVVGGGQRPGGPQPAGQQQRAGEGQQQQQQQQQQPGPGGQQQQQPAPAPQQPAGQQRGGGEPPPPRPRLTAAFFTFDQLCGPHGLRRGMDRGGPLAAADCLALAESGLRAVYLEGVPRLGPRLRDEARRLVTLVDVLYDAGVTLHMSCEAPPDTLFHPLLGAALSRGVNPNLGRAQKLPLGELRAQAAAAGLDQGAGGSSEQEEEEEPPPGAPRGRDWGGSGGSAGGGGYLGGALVAEEVLMYHRAASRLAEMTRGGGGTGGG